MAFQDPHRRRRAGRGALTLRRGTLYTCIHASLFAHTCDHLQAWRIRAVFLPCISVSGCLCVRLLLAFVYGCFVACQYVFRHVRIDVCVCTHVCMLCIHVRVWLRLKTPSFEDHDSYKARCIGSLSCTGEVPRWRFRFFMLPISAKGLFEHRNSPMSGTSVARGFGGPE